MRAARFPYKKYIEDFNNVGYNHELIREFGELRSLKFIQDKENILLIESPGSGKTHYSIGLGIKACMIGLSVLFISVQNLMIELKEAMSLNQLNSYKRKFEKYDLVILDELPFFSLYLNHFSVDKYIMNPNAGWDKGKVEDKSALQNSAPFYLMYT